MDIALRSIIIEPAAGITATFNIRFKVEEEDMMLIEASLDQTIAGYWKN